MTVGNREERLKELAEKITTISETVDREQWTKILQEMTVLKIVNRSSKLKSNDSQEVSKNDVIISIIADLQQHQDKESELRMKQMSEMVNREILLVIPLPQGRSFATIPIITCVCIAQT